MLQIWALLESQPTEKGDDGFANGLSSPVVSESYPPLPQTTAKETSALEYSRAVGFHVLDDVTQVTPYEVVFEDEKIWKPFIWYFFVISTPKNPAESH